MHRSNRFARVALACACLALSAPVVAQTTTDSTGRPIQEALHVATGTLAGVGATTSPVTLRGPFNATVIGSGDMALALERSFDRGVTWAAVHEFSVVRLVVNPPDAICEAQIDAACTNTGGFSRTYSEPEYNVLYRMRATSWTDGSVVIRLSQ